MKPSLWLRQHGTTVIVAVSLSFAVSGVIQDRVDRTHAHQIFCEGDKELRQGIRDAFKNSVGIIRQPGVPDPDIESFIDRYISSINHDIPLTAKVCK